MNFGLKIILVIFLIFFFLWDKRILTLSTTFVIEQTHGWIMGFEKRVEHH